MSTSAARQSAMGGASGAAFDGARLSRKVRVAVWLLLLIVATSNAVLLLALANVHWSQDAADNVGDTFANFLVTLKFQFNINANIDQIEQRHAFINANAQWVALAYVILAVPFVQMLVTMLLSSLLNGHCTFGFASTKPNCLRCFHRFRQVSPNSTRSHPRVIRAMDAVKARISAWRRGVEIGGELFERQFLVIEVIEITLQTIQAHQLSQSVVSRLAGVWYAIVILLNCWSALFVHGIVRYTHMPLVLGHIMHLAIDQLLGCLWGTLPIGYYLHVCRQWFFNPPSMEADSLMATASIAQQLVIPSWRGFVLINFSFAISAIVQRNILSFMHDEGGGKTPRVIQVVPRHEPHERELTRAPQTYQSRQPWLQRLLRYVRPAHGALVLALTALSGFRSIPVGVCEAQVFPWFAFKPACTGLEIKCSAHNDQILHIFDQFTLDYTTMLEITECDALDMPAWPSFPLLSTVRVSASTIARWDFKAALKSSALPVLEQVAFQFVTFTSVPEGFAVAPLPPTVTILTFDSVNADSFVFLVNDSWQSVEHFDCNGCGLSEFPTCVRFMSRLQSLSLSVNMIADVPENALPPASPIQTLSLTDNPIKELPVNVWLRLCSTLFASTSPLIPPTCRPFLTSFSDVYLLIR